MRPLKHALVSLKTRFSPPAIYHVSDAANWVFDEIAQELTTSLNQFNVKAYVTQKPFALNHQIIHFGDRINFFSHRHRLTNSPNHLFLTWHHSNPRDTQTGLEQFENLQQSLDMLNRVVVACQITYDDLVGAGIPAEKLCLIPIGIRLTDFPFLPDDLAKEQARQKLGVPAGAFCIGSFQKDGHGWGEGNDPKLIKGPDVFLDVLAALQQKYDNLFVLLTGPSRGYVKQRLDKLGIPYRHDFLDDYHNILPYYYALDLYIIASRLEGGPRALLESFATGVPVVSTRVGMSADLIKSGENGLLTEIGDIAALTHHAQTLIESPDLRQAFRQKARQTIQAYDWSHVARQYYENLYRPILNKYKFLW